MTKYARIRPIETPRTILEINKLLQIKKRCEFEIETTIKLINGQNITGEIILIEGYNPLVIDEFIPINFLFKKDNNIQRISFKEINLNHL